MFRNYLNFFFFFVISVQTIKEDTRGASRKVKRVPRFEQGKKETDRAFYLRMERETQKAIKTVEFEEKFQVNWCNTFIETRNFEIIK